MKTTILIAAFVAVAATAPVNPYWRYEHLRTLNVTEVKRVNPCCYRGETVAAPNCPLGPRSLDDLCQDKKHPSDNEETPVTPETERHEHLIPLRGHPKAKGSIEHRSQESTPHHDNLIPLRRHPKPKGRIQYHSEEQSDPNYSQACGNTSTSRSDHEACSAFTAAVVFMTEDLFDPRTTGTHPSGLVKGNKAECIKGSRIYGGTLPGFRGNFVEEAKKHSHSQLPVGNTANTKARAFTVTKSNGYGCV
ncbi:hypothetical protein FALBO_11270 [Fusarium albosuccineum]|uniref:Uncharacterized protein n=1 Tax=Fusarium albosuccineum TaxID=1237068 RepID=A0A8H4L683_9HYPO|nr:hypothetical protein FALBO_11270 [Fusarium albosuccineum]